MKLYRLAAVLAWIIGAMAVFAGGQVIFLGKVMDYYVIEWLPYYNFTVGVITAVVTAVLLWKGHRYATSAAIATFVAHASVMGMLLTVYRRVVAPDSLRAMTVRLTAWIIILALLYLQSRRQKQATA